MKLRYLHLQSYPPLQDVAICFSSNLFPDRDCAIRFVVGLNGSGKSHLLRAIAEVFLAMADQRPPQFPTTLVYELGRDNRKRTVVLDCPGTRATSSLWLAEGFVWPPQMTAADFSQSISNLRASKPPAGFRPLIAPGEWPASLATPPAIALPRAVLAYTTGLMTPWSHIWRRISDTGGIDFVSQGLAYDVDRERPPGWSAEREPPPQPESVGTTRRRDLGSENVERISAEWRPILVTPKLLKCALLAVALPHALKEFVDYPREEVEKFLGPPRLRALLERGGWKSPVTIAVRIDFRPDAWSEAEARRAREWLLCAGEVIAEPRPSSYRTLFFDIRGPFSPTAIDSYVSDEGLLTARTQGDALLALLGGFDSTPFELFEQLRKLLETGFIEGLDLGVSRTDMPDILRFDEFSDGEQMVLGRTALFQLLENEDDALLLLDEPETHFNDRWKREIVEVIDGALRRTASDVLIATHSAIVLTDVFNEEIILMERRDSTAVARTVQDKTFASDPSELIIRVFGAEDSIGQRARDYIRHVLSDMQNSPANIEHLKALVDRLGSGFYRSELRALIHEWEDNA